MAAPKRHGRLPGTYFVTSRTWESRRLFVTEPTCALFVEALFHYRDEGKYSVHALVLMPDHFHVLLTPAEDVALERAVQFIKGGSSHRMGIERGGRLPVWQRGFSDHRIRDAADYAVHQGYVEMNPVRRGLAAAPKEYRWSSASGLYRLDEAPQRLKPPGWGTARYGTAEAVP